MSDERDTSGDAPLGDSTHWRRGGIGQTWRRDPNDEVVRQANIRIRADDATAAYKAAVEGLGISRVPDFMITHEVESGALVEILKDYAAHPTPVHLIYVRQGLLPLKVRAFLDWMAPRLRKALKQIDDQCDAFRARDRTSFERRGVATDCER